MTHKELIEYEDVIPDDKLNIKLSHTYPQFYQFDPQSLILEHSEIKLRCKILTDIITNWIIIQILKSQSKI